MFFEVKITFLIFISIIFYCGYSEVIMMQAIIRHAERNPLGNDFADWYYPNDPYKDKDWKPEGPMELNNAGKNSAYNLGVFLRERYRTLLGERYNPRQIYFRSADPTRCINTALAVAAGLFPPASDQIWNEKLLWLPIPVHVEPLGTDHLNYGLFICKNYAIDKEQAYVDIDRIFGVLSDVQQFLKFLSVNTGATHTNPSQGWILYHQLASQVALNLTLEPWTYSVFPNGSLVDISAVEYIAQTYTMRMKRLVGGIWIKNFLDIADDLIVNKTSEIKGYFYATNEIQIAGILNAIGAYKPHVPGYASTILIELHEIDSEYYVKMLYKNEGAFDEIFIPGCQKSLCLLSTYRTVLDKIVTKDFDEDCGEQGYFPLVDVKRKSK